MNLTETSDVHPPPTAIATDRMADASARDLAIPTGPDSAANWLWVAPDIGRACVLIVGEISLSYRRGLAARFERVDQIPMAALQKIAASVDATSDGRAQLAYETQLPYEDGSIDCVISTDLVNRWSESRQSPFRDARFVAVLAELRRVLRPSGVLFLGGRNARWYRA